MSVAIQHSSEQIWYLAGSSGVSLTGYQAPCSGLTVRQGRLVCSLPSSKQIQSHSEAGGHLFFCFFVSLAALLCRSCRGLSWRLRSVRDGLEEVCWCVCVQFKILSAAAAVITPPCASLNHLISAGVEPQHVWEIFLMTRKFFSPPLPHFTKETHLISGFLSQPPAVTELKHQLSRWLASNASVASSKRDLWFGLVNHPLSLSCVALLSHFLPLEIMGSTVQQCLQTHHPS